MVERADINSVLSQLRQVREQVKSQGEGINLDPKVHLNSEVDKIKSRSVNFPDIPSDPNVPDFKTMFKNAINNVNEQQMEAGNLKKRFEKGDPMVDLPEVMIAAQKAGVAFQAMKEVRNKLVDAYKDISNMPV